MRRTLTAVLLAAMLAFSLVPAYADPGIGEEQYGGLQEAVDAAKDGEIIEVSKEDDAESITVAGKRLSSALLTESGAKERLTRNA